MGPIKTKKIHGMSFEMGHVLCIRLHGGENVVQ